MPFNVRSVVICGIVCAVTAVTAFGQSNMQATIQAANDRFLATFAAGNAGGLAAMYTADAMAFPPGSEIVKGRAAIQKMWQGVIDSGVKSATLTTIEVESHGDVAHEVGNYAMKDASGKVLDSGKYLVVWKREQGTWRLHRDIWNSSPPSGR